MTHNGSRRRLHVIKHPPAQGCSGIGSLPWGLVLPLGASVVQATGSMVAMPSILPQRAKRLLRPSKPLGYCHEVP